MSNPQMTPIFTDGSTNLCLSVTLLKKGRAETRRRKVTKEKFVFIREIRGFFQWTHL